VIDDCMKSDLATVSGNCKYISLHCNLEVGTTKSVRFTKVWPSASKVVSYVAVKFQFLAL
jgi:hypothetical protein